jgi:Kdo2-lipid IVA lauroyltransferase/acyltransferase
MSGDLENPPTPLKWRLECLGHSLIEALAGCLPGPWAFRLGELLGGLAWYFFPQRRKIILRNLRIAFAGEMELPALRRMTRDTFLRTGANMVSAVHTARLSPAKLDEVIHIENLDLLEKSLAGGKGVVLLLAHMGNWEILSRIVHLFPKGSKTGAFYRPLNNKLMDARVLARRQADGTRMFSKKDNPLQVAGFLREGGIVGILADQRVGMQGELVEFFGRITRASPLPSLLARRSKSAVLALAVTTEQPGRWRAVFMPVATPATTEHCMVALEAAMKRSLIDVFWFQERWKAYVSQYRSARDWLGPDANPGVKPLRALIWLADTPAQWAPLDGWIHPDVSHEVVLAPGAALPAWLPPSTRVHTLPAISDCRGLRKALVEIDIAELLPIDYLLALRPTSALREAACQEAIRLVSMPHSTDTPPS